MINKLKWLRNNIWLLVIIFQPILDVFSYFQTKFLGTSYTWIVRFLLLFLLFIETFIKSKDKKKLILCLIPFAIYYFLHILNLFRINQLSLIDDTKYFIAVYQLPVLTILCISYMKNTGYDLKKISLGFIINFFIIAITVVLSVITKTYETTYYNLGLIGWFSSANTQSMILCAVCSWSLFCFLENRSKLLIFFAFLVAFFLLYFNGTRSCYYTLIMSLVMLLYCELFDKKNNNRKFLLIITFLFLIFSFGLFKTSITFSRKVDVNHNIEENKKIIDEIENNKTNETKREELREELNEKKENVKCDDKCQDLEIIKSSYLYMELINIHGEEAIYEAMKNHIDAKVLSNNRYRKSLNARIEYNKSDLLTKALGIGFSRINKNGLDMENDLSAIFAYYGFIGFLVYMLIYFYIVVIMFKYLLKDRKTLFNKTFIYLAFLIVLLLFGGEYSGALLRKSNANIYMALLLAMAYLNFGQKSKKISDDKITFLNLHLGYGGIETATINSANALSQKYDVEIISFYNLKNNQTHLLNEKVNIKYLCNEEPNREQFMDAMKKRKVFKVLREGIKAFKILLLKKMLIIKEIKKCNSMAIVSTRWDFSILLSKYGRSGVIKIAQEHHHHNGDKKYINVLKTKYNNIDYLCALTDSLKKDYEMFLKDNDHTKIIKLPNIIPNKAINLFSQNNRDIICVSRLNYSKKIDELIEIFSKLENKSNKLYIIGDGDEEERLIKIVKKLNLEKRVIFTGYLDHESQKKYYKKSVLFAMTSLTEGLPMVLLEAMQFGIPCIAYETDSGINDIIENNYNGIIIKNRNKEKYVSEINRIINDPKLLTKFSKNAIVTSEKFSSENILKIWTDILKKNY